MPMLPGSPVITDLGDLWCLTFVRGLDEAEALRRVGAEERGISPLTYEWSAWPPVNLRDPRI